MSPAGRRSDQRRSDGGPTATCYLGDDGTEIQTHGFTAQSIIRAYDKHASARILLKNECA